MNAPLPFETRREPLAISLRAFVERAEQKPNAVMVDGLSRREAAKRFGVHRNTVLADEPSVPWA